METIKKYMRWLWCVIKRTFDPIFILFAMISFGLWYFNQLNNTFDTTVIIPVKIENDTNSSIGILSGTYYVECHVHGQGYKLLRYKLNPENNIEYIDISRLDIVPIKDSVESEIRASSLFTALSAQMTDVSLISILTPQLRIITSEIRSRKVPVISRISVDYEKQYMQVGDMTIDPDSVEVRSVQSLLDTLQGIYTESRNFNNVSNSLIGYIPLVPVENIVLPVENVSYSIVVDEYTEIDIKLPVEVRNIPSSFIPIVLPSEVDVKINISRSRFSDNIKNFITLYVDYNDHLTNIDRYFKVYTDTGEGISLRSMEPMYVELLYQTR